MADPIDFRAPMPNQSQGQQVPVYSQASPGVGGAIQDAIKALAMALSPKALTQRRANIDQQVSQADPAANTLGNQF